jgi:hypothetical protein
MTSVLSAPSHPTGTADLAAGPQSADAQPVTLARVVRSEWVKLRSLRSTGIVLGLTAVLMVALGMLITYFSWHGSNAFARARFDAIDRSLSGAHLAMLTVGVLGVLVITGEYTTGMIRSTLSAVPRRLPVVWAKVAVFAPVTFVVSLVSALVAFLVSQALIAPHGASLSSPGALRAVVGVALFLTVMGIMGTGLGFLTRSTAGGITSVVGLTFVLQAIGAALPASWQHSVVPYLPLQAGEAVFTIRPDTTLLAPWPGFALFCAYAALTVLAGAYTLEHRDA